ncbi:MAG: heme o synthase [Chloroflexota bacterium]
MEISMGIVPLPFTSKNFRRLTVFTAGWILLLILVGAGVRTTGFGPDCPDWPLLCAGQLWPGQATGWLNFGHRLAAMTAGLLSAVIGGLAWRDYRSQRLIFWPALSAVVLAGLQVLSGAAGVWFDVQPLAAVGYLAVTLWLATVAHLPAEVVAQAGLSARSHKTDFRYLLLAGAAMLLLLLTGSVVSGTHSGLACPDWPLCRGEIFPANASLGMILNLIHRFSVAAVGVVSAAAILKIRRHYKKHTALVKWSAALGWLYLVQIGLGGLNVWVHLPAAGALHTWLAAATWGSLVVLVSLFYLTARAWLPVDEETAVPLAARQKAAVYFKLTKPWIMILLLITTAGAMFIAGRGLPSISRLLYTLLGGALSAGGASVLNSYIDSDIDRKMSRTSRRPTVTGLVTAEETLFFGLALSTMSFVVLAVFVNTLSAALSTLGIIYYVFFYTLYLKRSTIHNIVIGGAAGAIPPLVGWTAVTNTLDLGALYLFAVIFFWTPPHTWALALLLKKDYAQAGVPMLPVVVGEKETTYQIFLYSLLLVTLTVLPFTFKMLSWVYLVVALGLGLFFIYLAWRLWRNYNKSLSKRLYKYSQAYLALLFLMMALDRSLF